ncbi:MAG: 4-alpha-glucanotransferase [Candidatus Brocadiaceae bacterium]
MNRRSSGILLHITSLPSPYGIGDFGTGAYKFVDFLAETKQGFWQILPLNPTDSALGNSPYYSPSAFASNTILISPELMFQSGLLEKGDLDTHPTSHGDRVDYHKAITHKKQLFCRAYERFKGKANTCEYEKFCKENSYWLEDFALFVALKEHFRGQLWNQWPWEICDRRPETLQSLKKQHCDKIELEKFLQFIFSQQWASLKEYSNNRGIQIIGDIPIYVCFDSADVWAHPDLFKLNENKQPMYVAGVPPDYFSATGQYWGNPVYQWDRLKETGYQWWIQRIQRNITLFDMMRIDHFRGFVAYWEIPSTEKTAVNGRWVEAPAENFITTLLKRFSHLPFIAEDLGVITPDVKEIIQRFGFPGMRILLFAFGGDLPTNPYAPHNYIRNCVAYTGTHDNNTVKGWFEKEATKEDKERLYRYLGREISAPEVNGEFIRIVMMSAANLVLFPMQDILGLGGDARMNRPAITEGNWSWRLSSEQITPSLIQKLRDMTEIYGRA